MVRAEKGTTRVGKYELGRTLGEGNFGKVKHAKHVETGEDFAVKILDRKRVLQLKIDDQIKREIGTLKLLRHPNVVRLYEVLASKTKIYMVLEFVDGGDLFNKIEHKGRLQESEGRKIFQQLIDAINYCHAVGVYHRDLKPENILIDSKGNIKISDFGLSALQQDIENDGLLHTTCGSPSYIAPEVLSNRGYDGSMSDIWSCGVVLYVMLVGYLPFEDRNIAVLYQKIFKGETKVSKWLSPGAQNLIRRMLDPNPMIRINITSIRGDDWFNQHYTPIAPDDNEDISIDNISFSIKEAIREDGKQKLPMLVNAFELIGMSSYLDLSGFFEKEDIFERRIRFTTSYLPSDLFERIESIATKMGLEVQKGYDRLKVIQVNNGLMSLRSPGSLLIVAQVFELSPFLYIVELRKSYGDSTFYRELCRKISEDLVVYK